MAKGKQAAVEGDGAAKGTGLTQRLIDNSSRVHKQSNALLLTKVRSQLSRCPFPAAARNKLAATTARRR